MLTWIYDFARGDFEPFQDCDDMPELIDRSSDGEILLHLFQDGSLSIIEDREVRDWPCGHEMEINFRIFHRWWFAPSP